MQGLQSETQHQQLIHQLHWRYATKQFDASKTIPAEIWSALEEALVLTPSSYGMQPWKFIVVTDPAIRERLVPISWGQRQPAQCSHHVVFAAKTKVTEADVEHYLDRIVTVRGGSREATAGLKKMLVSDVISGPRSAIAEEWATRQAYIALGNFMTCAALLGIDTCPMEGIEPAKYDEVLGLRNQGLSTVVACAAGYRSAEDKYAKLSKVRFPREEMIERV